jgi:hypothetical protein
MNEENMEQEKQENCKCDSNCHCFKGKKWRNHHYGGGGGSGAIYGLGVFGAAFYFLQNVTGLGAVLLGIAKAFFWPAFLVFKLFTVLKI